ncbi:MAG: ATP-binding protein [Candidatus Aminicenantes bacterium]|nr:ATP-binding protein [Candidatus Aminicenantes bacterium]
MYKERWLAEKLKKSLKVSSVLILTGARQTGKTTLLMNEPILKTYKYFSLDDLDVLAQAQKDPSPIISSARNIIIDEAQRVPKLLYAIKQAVDSDRGKGRCFVLSGSANLLLLKNISETLAGRATYHTLFPFTYSEYQGSQKPEWLLKMFKKIYPKEKEKVSTPPSLTPILFRGFLPPVLEFKPESYEEISMWWDGYIKTYLERDLRDLSQVSSLTDFRAVMQLLALRTASLVDQSGISRDTGISQPTVHRYLNLLEASNLFVRLKPFTKIKSKSITKTPKGYFIDPGLAAHLAGHKDPSAIDEKFKGNLFESLVLLNLLCLAEIYGMNVYFWRTKEGKEVDFILEYGRGVLPVEVKMSSKVQYADLQNLLHFLKMNPQAVGGVVIYTGSDIQKLASNIFAIPWVML